LVGVAVGVAVGQPVKAGFFVTFFVAHFLTVKVVLFLELSINMTPAVIFFPTGTSPLIEVS